MPDLRSKILILSDEKAAKTKTGNTNRAVSARICWLRYPRSDHRLIVHALAFSRSSADQSCSAAFGEWSHRIQIVPEESPRAFE